MRIKTGKRECHWLPEQIALLKEFWTKPEVMSSTELARKLDRTILSLRKKASKLKLHRGNSFTSKRNGKARTTTLKLRFEILKRDDFMCVYCGRSGKGVVLHVDHKIPVSRGGEWNSPENLVTACLECNLGKRDVLLEERQIKKEAQTIEISPRFVPHLSP